MWQRIKSEIEAVLFNDCIRIVVGAGIATGYGAGRQRGRNSSPVRGKMFLVSTSSRPVLRPMGPGVKRPRVRVSIPPLPRTSSWHSA
jgi:hypothetical protein